ncbi:hypothetical protein FRUB_04599 [Fimbriiglobus ruber]|uniref:Uncharacterized protein n=2 Tax=Fimbriiglobus ruber TaxID=1908690 RepID=A0A225DUG2_9BACT|nr:hypothetical protein FRUB_04599 [Fimbriiglobus ruber]
MVGHEAGMATATAFHTPPRILIPKLVRSRDAWRAKATARKAERKALTIRVRDLEASRAGHRARAEQLQERVTQLEQQLAAARRPTSEPPAGSPPAPQKNRTGPGVGNTTSRSSPSP